MSESEEGIPYEGEERRGVLEPEGMVERRQHPRYAIDAWAEVMVKDATALFRGRVLDISAAGCFIATEARLKLAQGTAVEMVFRTPNGMVCCEASWRMTRTNGASFRFERVDPRTRILLDRLIAELEREQG